MKAVRQWMIKPFRKNLPAGSLLLLLPLLGALTSCNPTEITGNGVRSNVIANDGSMDGMAYIYPDNPYILGGSGYSATNPNMGLFIERTPRLVTNNLTLLGRCRFEEFFTATSLDGCIKVLKDETTVKEVSRKADGTYIFAPNSSEFYQANTLYHLQFATDKFMQKLSEAYATIRHSINPGVVKSIPQYMPDHWMYWFNPVSDGTSKLFQNRFLTAYSQCDLDENAMFSTIGPKLCFGYFSSFPGFYFVQDPTIIYHEMGHAFVSIMMNLRNGANMSTHPLRSNLGSYGYDEAGAINEGIADYFSYMMNKRESMGEFALGTTAKQSRPLSELSPLHIHGIDDTSEGRLSYPQYVNYDPNTPNTPTEAVHYAGQITSHYLVALTKSFKDTCQMESGDAGHEKATSWIVLLLSETLSELGDLNARGIDKYNGDALDPSHFAYFNNLDETSSYLWSQVMGQVTYRKFYQTFSKNINKYISGNLCTAFSKPVSEKLLDDYGLLLFKTYNDNGNSTKDRAITYSSIDSRYAARTPATATPVSEENRRKSVLIKKEQLELAVKTSENPSRSSYFVIDGRAEMNAVLKELLFKGYSVPLSKDVASTAYNNKNLKISPGEIVAIIPNLLNKSNSTMAGVQLLATDWDHVDITDPSSGNFKPCAYDKVTTVDQGAVAETYSTCASTAKDYKRLIYNTATQKFPDNAAAPVCLVQLEEGTSTRWVSQNEFRKKQGLALQDRDCLGSATSNDSDFMINPHECLVRFLPGANDAFFSRIEPQKSYSETMFPAGSTTGIYFNSGNSLILEANKWIPPGTKFRCRMRARFSNCSDCYTDGSNGNDDFLDYELNGHKPFQIINFDFEVND